MITTNWRTNERLDGDSFKSDHTVTTTVTKQQTDWEPDATGARVLQVDGEEIANFEEQKERFRAGDFEETPFMRFRLRQGYTVSDNRTARWSASRHHSEGLPPANWKSWVKSLKNMPAEEGSPDYS